MLTCWISAGPQHGDERDVIHDDHYQLLLKEATR